MPAPEPSTSEPRGLRPRFRVGGLLLATTLLALLMAFCTAAPRWLTDLLYPTVLGFLVSGLVGGAVVLQREARAFCITALCPLVSEFGGDISRSLYRLGLFGLSPGFDMLLKLGGMVVVMACCGLVGAAVAHGLLRSGLPSEPDERE